MKRNIDGTTSPDLWHYADLAPVLELYANVDFDNSENQRILAGDPQFQNFYRALTCSVVDGQLAVPIFEDVDTTEDSPDNQLATYSAYLRINGQQPVEWLLNFRVPPSTTTPVSSIDWTTLRIHKSGILQRDPLLTYTRQEILALIETQIQIAIGTLNDAAVGVKGRAAASYPPVLPTMPIFIGQNDPLITSVIDDPGVAGVYSIQSAANSFWFENQGGRVNRVGGRLLVGDAALSDGDTPNTNKDWMETMGGSGAYRLPFSGTVTTSGTAVTWVSGDVFPDYPPGALVGQVIIINSVHYTIASVTNSTHLVLTSSAGVQGVAVAYAVGQGVLQGTNSAQFVSLTTSNISSNIAAYAGAQTRYNTQDVYAGCDVAVNNNLTMAVPIWGRYIEAHSWNLLDSVSNETTGVEIEVINRSGLSTPVCPNPYTPSTTRLTSALQLGAGGGLDSVGQYDATMGILFYKNPMKYKGGILFGVDSIAASGPGGSIPAILLARDQQVQWYRTDGQLCAAMYGGGSTDELHVIASGGLMVGTEGGSSFSGPNALVDSVQATRGLNLVTTDAQDINKGAQLGLGGRNGSGGSLETFSFATIAGRKEDNTANHYDGYFQVSTCSQLGQLLERMRVTSVGNVKIAGTVSRGTTEGTNHLDIFDGAAPVGTLANGISLYSTAGELRVMDAAGNATLLSPHDQETNEWIYLSKNTVTGQVLRIEMERLMKAVNDLLGADFVHQYSEAVM